MNSPRRKEEQVFSKTKHKNRDHSFHSKHEKRSRSKDALYHKNKKFRHEERYSDNRKRKYESQLGDKSGTNERKTDSERKPEKEYIKSHANQKKENMQDNITFKTGGAYIPPAKLRMMRDNITDKSRYVNSSAKEYLQ